jgi:phage shock protein A
LFRKLEDLLMQWLTTFSLVIRSNISTLIERFENPERVLNQLILDMEEELVRVRASTAGVIADEIQLGKRVEAARSQAQQWHERAASALKSGDEATARAALEQKMRADQQAESLDREYRPHQAETEKLHRSVHDLEGKIRQANHRRALLLARLTRAESARSVQQVLRTVETQSALAQFERLEQRVSRAEALEQAYDRMEGRDPETEDLKRQFEQKEHKERLQREFDELKQRLDDPE